MTIGHDPDAGYLTGCASKADAADSKMNEAMQDMRLESIEGWENG